MPESTAPRDLIVVATHAPFREEVQDVPEHPEGDEGWALQPCQRGEPPFYIEHIRRGAVLAAHNPAALLIFSGGQTRKEAGRRSEAAAYVRTAQFYDFWIRDTALRASVAKRAAAEDYARDSFENLLFGICRFQQVAGQYPRNLVVVGWAFKGARFDLCRAALRFPAGRFRYEGCNDPIDLKSALRGESKTLRDFIESRYGAGGDLALKREERDPFHHQHPYASCPGLSAFFEFIGDPENGQRDFPGRLPWEDQGPGGA
ncbi:MAG: hypothetical protein Q8O76_02430 [Chloroflexota bacterium]|nr:hypothetical protein [Chloroflexota bacterium]